MSSTNDTGWDGSLAMASEGGWYYDGSEFEWMSGLFAEHSKAFVYWMDESGDPLPSGATSGFMGTTNLPSSPFAVLLDDDTKITGDTNVVPIPSAIWLLGSGIIGIMGFRRNFKKSFFNDQTGRFSGLNPEPISLVNQGNKSTPDFLRF